MHTPLIRYLVSSPYGDVPVDTGKLDLSLECDPLKTPYKIYFQSIKDFLDKDKFKLLLKAVSKKYRREVHANEINEIIIRAEKHGALYHPASLELILEECSLKLGLNVAVSETGRNWLKKEFSVVQNINTNCKLPYLPEVYFFDEQETMSFLLEEWFEGYHEFHLSLTESGKQCIKLWEFGKGYKYLSTEQSFEIYRQASKILTLYYDINDFCQIYPWHHAAGDFVVRIGDENKEGKGEGYFQDKIDLRLTTARQYEPYMVFQEKEHINPVIALFFFLLNLTIKMRLDKLDGVGDTIWADDICLEATIKGFLDGLRLKEEFKNYFGSEKEFFNILKSFHSEDLKTAYSPLIDLYNLTGDYPVITAKLNSHVEALYTILQNFPL
ncbi:MAG: hypothetical protein L6246_10040 [Thermodesulfovibrionales bacterium]|nr:hypothetical protein [Nitrospinota bacterium]MCG2710638.1 hypothetical protein [Thermodesulfovibrionales bacterium]